VDVFLATGRNKEGFYNRDAVRAFFKALNEACEEDSPPGEFAWKAIYNDEPIAHEMDGLYGERRVLYGVEGHGPGPSMHIHLDLRPLHLQMDTVTGFYLDAGRVVFSPPPPQVDVPMPIPVPPPLTSDSK
jgi:hypothetical protein